MSRITELAPCSMCHEGFQLNPNTGGLLMCTVCKGMGLVTPENICYCGLSCTTTIEGYNTCGDPKCLEGFKKAAFRSPNPNLCEYWN
jgi:hypothetical protein